MLILDFLVSILSRHPSRLHFLFPSKTTSSFEKGKCREWILWDIQKRMEAISDLLKCKYLRREFYCIESFSSQKQTSISLSCWCKTSLSRLCHVSNMQIFNESILEANWVARTKVFVPSTMISIAEWIAKREREARIYYRVVSRRKSFLFKTI